MGDCIIWTKSRDRHGYGRTVVGSRTDGSRRTVLAHRLAFHKATGIDPAGKVVRHTCDNPSCVNPAHLVLGDQKDNIADMVQRRRGLVGEKNGHSKLSEQDAKAIKVRVLAGDTHARVAREYGIDRSLVTMIATGKRWAHV